MGQIIRIDSGWKIIRGKTILRNVDIAVPKGVLVSLAGASGAGKTTILNIMGLLDDLTQGDYFFFDSNITKTNNRAMAALRSHYMGYIFQTHMLMENLSILDNVCLPLRYRKTLDVTDYLKAKKTLAKVGLEDVIETPVIGLSGGQKQRVAFARALVSEPKILFADEPTAALDSANANELMDLLASERHRNGMTIIMITHNKLHAEKYSNLVYNFVDGRVTSS